MHLRIWAATLLLGSMALVAGCGGSHHDDFSAGGGGGGGGGKNCGNGCSGGGGSGPIASATPVTVTPGQNTSGVDIAVVTPASNPTPNAFFIGTGDLAAGIPVFNVGTTITQGSTTTVALLGTGLTGNIQVGISGPTDITVSNIQATAGQSGLPDSVTFTAVVDGSAALGARTVVLQDANNDITTFTGGLEVIP
jgi:hypothetical protein